MWLTAILNSKSVSPKAFDFVVYTPSYFSEYLELYLRHVSQTTESKEFLDELDAVCTYEYDGSQLYKYIHIFVSI